MLGSRRLGLARDLARDLARASARASPLMIAALLCALPEPSAAHELRPGMLRVELVEATGDDGEVGIELHLRLPPQVSAAAWDRVRPVFPPGCALQGTAERDAESLRWRGLCEGMPVGALELEGLGRGVEVVVDLRCPGRPPTTTVLDQGVVILDPEAEQGAALSRYLHLGVEHILFGLDHLLFVFGLVLLSLRSELVLGARRWSVLLGVLGTLTAFTIAHSLTLGAAVLGWVQVPGPPVEACIALSIVLLAREVVRPSPKVVAPWGFAFACGLLHGFGFAGALAQVGLPSEAILRPLLLFNVGVELGQLAIAIATGLGFVLLVHLAARIFGRPAPAMIRALLGTALGSIAVAWTLERVLEMIR